MICTHESYIKIQYKLKLTTAANDLITATTKIVMKNSFWYLQTYTEGILSKEECLCNGPMNAMCVLEKS